MVNKRIANTPLRKACAIGYSAEKDSAPHVLAMGSGRTAEQIIAVARESGVAVIEDAALAEALDASVNPGDFIPAWCWEAVAKILIFVLEASPFQGSPQVRDEFK